MQRRKTIGNSFGFIEPSESRLRRDTGALNYPQWTLLTRVRGIRILGSSYPRSCIPTPRYPRNHPSETLHYAPAR